VKKKTTRRGRAVKKNRFMPVGLWLIALLVIVLLVIYFMNRGTVKATFNCDGNKTITSVFHTGKGGYVNLKLNDGRKMDLDVSASAGGARYSNKSESVVFWNTGNTASLDEGNNTTFNNCIQK